MSIADAVKELEEKNKALRERIITAHAERDSALALVHARTVNLDAMRTERDALRAELDALKSLHAPATTEEERIRAGFGRVFYGPDVLAALADDAKDAPKAGDRIEYRDGEVFTLESFDRSYSHGTVRTASGYEFNRALNAEGIAKAMRGEDGMRYVRGEKP